VLTLNLISMLAQPEPTLLQRLVFGERPALWVILAYSALIMATVVAGFVALIPLFCIWWERKVSGRIQSRYGPNRVGPIGLLQSFADGIKLLTKEDLRPSAADTLLFRLAPYLAFVPVFAAFLAIPFAPDMVFEPNLAVGVFWILSILSVEVMGVILAGWGSNNKWSVYGAMREACQMVSYEIPLGLAIIVAVMAAGTLNLLELGMLQGGGVHTWLIFKNPFVMLAFLAYFVASLASNKRAPFDLPESESELVAGYHTEYSGLRFSFFFFAEYAAMFVVGAIQVTLFLGAWHDPFGLVGYWYHRFTVSDNAAGLAIMNLVGAAIFVLKCFTIIYVQMWIRWTLPRPRIDQVLYACVKVLLPLTCVLLAGAAVWQLMVPELRIPGLTNLPVPWADYSPFSWSQWRQFGGLPSLITQTVLAVIGVGLFLAAVGWIGYAFATRGQVTPRLFEAEPIGGIKGAEAAS
jgi:NADH-quinone oxidoreductase subunit H